MWNISWIDYCYLQAKTFVFQGKVLIWANEQAAKSKKLIHIVSGCIQNQMPNLGLFLLHAMQYSLQIDRKKIVSERRNQRNLLNFIIYIWTNICSQRCFFYVDISMFKVFKIQTIQFAHCMLLKYCKSNPYKKKKSLYCMSHFVVV